MAIHAWGKLIVVKTLLSVCVQVLKMSGYYQTNQIPEETESDYVCLRGSTLKLTLYANWVGQ